MRILARLIQISKTYWSYLISGFIALLVAGVISIWPSYALKLIIDALASGNLTKTVINLSLVPQQLINYGVPAYSLQVNPAVASNVVPLILLVLYMSDGFLKSMHFFNTRFFGVLVSNELREKAHKKLLSLSLNQVRQRNTGDLISCMTADLTLVQTLLADVLTTSVNDLATAFVLGFWLLLIDWKLSLVGLVIIPLFFFLISKVAKRLRKLANEGQKMAAVISGFISESVQGIDLIHLFNIENLRNQRFEEASKEFIKVWKKQLRTDASVMPFTGIVSAIGIGSVVWLGVQRVYTGDVSMGDFGSYLVATILLYQPIKRLSRINSQINSIIGTCQRVFELIDAETEIQSNSASETHTTNPDNLALKTKKLTVEFEDVKFHYSENLPVLNGLNLRIEEGEQVAIVGPSGSGKSSLIRMIPRLYDVTDGRIKVRGINIQDWNLDELRRQISFVTQDPFLFSGTLKDNLQIVNPSASEEDLQRALKLAKVDFLHLVDGGLDAWIGERGLNLSGGQRQRLSIARAILKDSPMMILDEPTSSLDQHSEELIRQSISELMSKRTIVLVTHKLNIIKAFPRIICMNQGKIVEEGNFRELMNKQGVFYNMATSERSLEE
ncbi:MAG: ABC transporter ATP-binding protein [Candidatus Caenarcaniphilales bacterium]|nr:ABC transporter ATP-binding protein [Candidatus Caenarcaniphilales bacterium]